MGVTKQQNMGLLPAVNNQELKPFLAGLIPEEVYRIPLVSSFCESLEPWCSAVKLRLGSLLSGESD